MKNLRMKIVALIFVLACFADDITGISSTGLDFNTTKLNYGSRQIDPNVFSCDSSDQVVQKICLEALSKINSELSRSGISIRNSGVLFRFEDPDDEHIDTGHSCSVTASVTHKHLSAHFSRSSTLRLSSEALTEVFSLHIRIPVNLNGRVDIRQRFGARILGSCSNFGRDSYSFKGSLETTADVVIGFTLNPSLARVSSSEYALKIQPAFAVMAKLENTDIRNFRVSGVSPITAVATAIVGITSTFLKAATALFTGDDIANIFEDAALFDFGVPILLGVGALPGPIERAVFERLSFLGERRAKERAEGFEDSAEDSLNRELTRALNLDKSGSRIFIIRKEVVDLLRQGKQTSKIFDEFESADPGQKCYDAACDVCLLTNDYYDCYLCSAENPECDKLSSDWYQNYGRFQRAKYTPSKPKIAQ